jgi:hypothetical protein
VVEPYSYGLRVQPNSGASQNYAARFEGDVNVETKLGIGSLFNPNPPVSELDVFGAVGFTVVIQASSTSATLGDNLHTWILNHPSLASDFTLNLPTLVGRTRRRYEIKIRDANGKRVIVTPAAGQTIDGAATKIISGKQGITIVAYDSTEWSIVSTSDQNFEDATNADEYTVTGSAQTTSTSSVTLLTIPTVSGSAYIIDALIVGKRTNLTAQRNTYKLHCSVRNTGGTPFGSQEVYSSLEENAAWGITIGNSGNNFLITASGNTGDTVEWRGSARIVRVV